MKTSKWSAIWCFLTCAEWNGLRYQARPSVRRAGAAGAAAAARTL